VAATAPRTSTRLLFADWLRGWAIVVMIEVHVFNALLRPDLRDTGWFRALNFVNGLVAPSFLFISGFVFIAASRRRLDDLRGFGPSLGRQLRRIGQIWLIAYLLHLPPAPLRQYFIAFGQLDWRAFYRVDILHCICATWLLLLASLIVIRRESLLTVGLVATSFAATLLAPWVWELSLSPPLPAPVAAYFNNRLESLFPLFPWSGFMLAGALCASLYLAANGGDRMMPRLALAGMSFVLLGAWLPGFAGTNWAADPPTFLLRLGIVLLLLGACWLAGRRAPPKDASLFLTMSRESLFIYVAHILVLFAPVWAGRGLAQVLGQNHGPVFCAAASAALIALMALAATFWSRRKRHGGRVQ
jgi:uncharacterized membrane protein